MMKTILKVLLLVTCASAVIGCHTRCKRSCRGIPNGQYQSCKNCNSFVFCYGGKMSYFPCSCNTKWDDFYKSCENSSTTCPAPKTNPCLTNCTNIRNGAFQYCKNCHEFIVCHNGEASVRDCPSGGEWDDSLKQCVPASTTCPAPDPPVPGPRCMRNCNGVTDGDYQSCRGCHVYASCVANKIYDNRPCPSNLVWDDFLKRCEYTSPTCPPNGKMPCMSNCTKQPNGTYQSCKSCRIFAKCVNGKLIDGNRCPNGLIWDDALKRCAKTSRTCNVSSAEPVYVGEREYPCITNCTGLDDGDYQSCAGCHVFAMCSNNNLYLMKCPADLLWDDNLKRCEKTSKTCPKLTYLKYFP